MPEVSDVADEADEPRVAVVMPAYDAAEHLPRVLPALLAAAGASEVLLVDAGSTDGTASVAAEHGVAVHRLDERAGPARARNEGVARVSAPVVLFVDSDCLAHEDTVERVRREFAARPGMVSLTGSYCDDPPARGFFSQYMNLRHHHTHQKARRENATFWAGCGAVRREAFLEAGGFDAERFPRPMIEDIELGLRLRRHGETRLDPDLQVTHLKRWTMRSVIATDIFARAVPWTRLILEGGGPPDDLNLRRAQRIAAMLAPLVLLSIPAAAVLALAAPRWLPLPLGVTAAALALSFDMVRFFARRRGIVFAALGFLFHQVHLTYSAATYALCTLTHRRGRATSEAAA